MTTTLLASVSTAIAFDLKSFLTAKDFNVAMPSGPQFKPLHRGGDTDDREEERE